MAVLVCLGSIGLLGLLLVCEGLQSKHMSDLNKDIAKDAATLRSQPDISKVLTVQNQLQSLTGLHSQKPAASRVFTYLNQVTPTQATITSFTIDFTQQTMTIAGTADSLSSVNKFVDTLKYTTYSSDGGKSTKAFSGVVLSSFAISGSGGQGNQAATYSVTLKYDPVIFDTTKKVKLTVPNITSTRATLNSSGDLFIPTPASTTRQGN